MTINDLAEMISDFATRVEGDIRDIKNIQAEQGKDIAVMKADIGGLRTGMVTKSYLDDKLFDKESDSGMALRKEDQKVDAVVVKLTEKNVINKQEATVITAMSPFAVQPN